MGQWAISLEQIPEVMGTGNMLTLMSHGGLHVIPGLKKVGDQCHLCECLLPRRGPTIVPVCSGLPDHQVWFGLS